MLGHSPQSSHKILTVQEEVAYSKCLHFVLYHMDENEIWGKNCMATGYKLHEGKYLSSCKCILRSRPCNLLISPRSVRMRLRVMVVILSVDLSTSDLSDRFAFKP